MLNKIKNIFKIKNNSKKRIYFDNASAIEFSDITKKNILNSLESFANASGIHKEGEESKRILDEARDKVARFMRAKKNEVFFGSSTTELNNIYIKGIILPHINAFYKKSASLNHFLLEDKIPETAKNIYKNLQNSKPHIITSLAEHSSVLEICKYLENLGAEVTYLKPSKIGRVLTCDILKSVKENTKIMCLSLVNSETGTLQDVKELKNELLKNKKNVKVFVDATQYIKYFSLDVHNLGVDALTFGANKLGSISGCAVLYKKQDLQNKEYFENIINGGGQEEGVRSGTENLLAIKLLAENLEHIKKEQKENFEYILELRKYIIEKIRFIFNENELEIFGDIKLKYNKFYEYAAPHILLMRLSGMLGEELLLRLDAKGIAVSTATACSILEGSGSNFLKSIGEYEKAKETIRISFNRKNTKEEIDYFIEVLKDIKSKYLN
jgi:cysteine desulfurase